MKSLLTTFILVTLALNSIAQKSNTPPLYETNIERPGRAMLTASVITFGFATSFAVQNQLQQKHNDKMYKPFHTFMVVAGAMFITASIQIQRDNSRRMGRIID